MQKKITLITFLLGFVVIVLGAYTRLTDAGLGCPDWPGCYGQVLAPTSDHAVQSANLEYPDAPVDVAKAWTEMVHRYFASTLGALILLLALITHFNKNATTQEKWLTRGLFGLVVFQGILGMWTVTLKLFPMVVMSHLLGGLLTVSLLWCLWHMQSVKPTHIQGPSPKSFVLICAGALFAQIALGGWTSTNYAALSCPNFPFCTDTFLPAFDSKAFNLFGALKLDDPLQFMTIEARQTIHMLHRIGAFVVTLMLIGLSVILMKYQQNSATKNQKITRLNGMMMFLLSIQLILGISNVLALLPLKVAMAHHAVAVVLLLLLLHIFFILPKSQTHATSH